jgi:hypothetical protein
MINYFSPSGDVILASKRLNGWRHSSMMGKSVSAHRENVSIILFNPIYD